MNTDELSPEQERVQDLITMTHCFSSRLSGLIEDLIDVSKGTTNLSEKTREVLAMVDQDIHIQVFVTPT